MLVMRVTLFCLNIPFLMMKKHHAATPMMFNDINDIKTADVTCRS